MDPFAAAAALRTLADNAPRGTAESLVTAARALVRAGRHREAEPLFREAAASPAVGADGLHAWAATLAALGDSGAARDALGCALDADPDHALALRDLAAMDEAGAVRRVWCGPGDAPATADAALGSLAAQTGPLARTAEARLLTALGRFDDAARAYPAAGPARRAARARVLRLAHRAPEADALDGTLHVEAGNDARGVALLTRALAAGAGDAEAHAALASALRSQGHYPEALDVAREGVRRFPDARPLQRLVVWLLARENRTADARAQAGRFAETHGADGFLDHVAALALPVAYRDEADRVAARHAYETGLADLEARVDARDADRWGGLLAAHNFFLGYQGEVDVDLQRRYGRLLGRVARAAVGDLPPVRTQPREGRLRVGFVSPYWRSHTVGRLFAGWITQRDRARIEAYVYTVGPGDAVTGVIRSAADASRTLPRATAGDARAGAQAAAAAARMLADDDLDAIVYPSIGMHPLMLALGSLRLAPVQAVAWGHPVTTGLDAIDLFLTSGAMEPPGADAHYTERLVRLPGIGAPAARFAPAPPAPRASFGLGDDDTVYVCLQSLFKLLPAYDRLYAAIAARDPRAVVVFIRDRSRPVTELTHARLAAAFEAAGADPGRQLVVLPRMPSDRFRALTEVADLALDAPGWSGGMTTLTALSVGTPTVTWPGPLMRGRHTAAMLRQIGRDDLVADSLDATVDLAVVLGACPDERARLRSAILARVDELFADPATVRALEDALHAACRAAPDESPDGDPERWGAT